MIGDTRSLIGSEEEQLIFDDWSAQCCAEAVVMKPRNFLIRGYGGIRIAEEGCGVHLVALEIFIDLTVVLVRAGFCNLFDMRATVAALRSVIHRRIDAEFFDRFGWCAGQALANRVVYRCTRLDIAAAAAAWQKILAGAQYKTVGGHLA